MSAEGYFKLPRKLMRAEISTERKYALAWLVSEASYAERECCGVTLRVGETPPLSLTGMEVRFGWSRKAVRLFLDYALSARCAEETGIRVRVGQNVQGHSEGHRQGHSEGHSKGHTYIIGLVKFAITEGHSKGHSEGHRQGHSEGHSIQKEGEKEGDNSSPTGKKQHKRARGSRKVPDDWKPDESLEQELRSIAAQRGVDYGEQMTMLRDHEFPRAYTDWPGTARNWFRKSYPTARQNGNGRAAGRTTDGDWRIPKPEHFANDEF